MQKRHPHLIIFSSKFLKIARLYFFYLYTKIFIQVKLHSSCNYSNTFRSTEYDSSMILTESHFFKNLACTLWVIDQPIWMHILKVGRLICAGAIFKKYSKNFPRIIQGYPKLLPLPLQAKLCTLAINRWSFLKIYLG